ncbi:DUF6538 domain-containing protein [Rhizobium wenxiniae]|uniref:DUF6538 domain-containing protein n=1 Tax=Rhizobium wenxiniae TaxID=1737357 RepID=UPI003C1C0FA8
MTVYPWLTLRNRAYYLRAPVPADLHEALKKTQIWKSLGTQDRRKAIEKLRIESGVVSEMFEKERRRQARLNEPPLAELTEAQLKIIGDVYFAHLLDEDEERRLGGFEGDDFDNAADWLDDLDKDNRHEAARGIMSPFMLDEAAEVLSWDGIELRLAENSPSWPRLVRAIYQARIKADGAKRQRNMGDVVETPKPAVVTVEKPQPSKHTLEEAKKFYITEKVSGTEFAQKKRKNRLDAITRTVKAALGEIPALPDWTVDDAYKVRDHMLGKGTLKPSSVRRELNDLKGVFSLYRAKKLRSMDNPFAGLDLPKSAVSDKEAREPLPADVVAATRAKVLEKANPDLKLIWRLLEGTGCRLAEITGLRRQDIILDGETPHLRIVPHEGRRLKNAASKRDVPLVGDALAAATEAHKASEGSAHAFARYSGPVGPNTASQSLMKWLRTVSTNRLHAIHSLRHNMADRCDLAGVHPTDKAAILGHLNAGASEKHYGSAAVKLVGLARAMRLAFGISAFS